MNDLREKIARVLAEAALRNIGMEINELPGFTIEPWFEEADAVLAVLREQEPVKKTTHHHSALRKVLRHFHIQNDGVLEADLIYAIIDTCGPLFLAPVPPAEPVVPEGWTLVPLNPTTEMLHAGQWREYVAEGGELIDAPLDTVADAYLNMLAAAPKYKGGE